MTGTEIAGVLANLVLVAGYFALLVGLVSGIGWLLGQLRKPKKKDDGCPTCKHNHHRMGEDPCLSCFRCWYFDEHGDLVRYSKQYANWEPKEGEA